MAQIKIYFYKKLQVFLLIGKEGYEKIQGKKIMVIQFMFLRISELCTSKAKNVKLSRPL